MIWKTPSGLHLYGFEGHLDAGTTVIVQEKRYTVVEKYLPDEFLGWYIVKPAIDSENQAAKGEK